MVARLEEDRLDESRVPENGIETESRRFSKLHRWIPPLSWNWLSWSTSKSTNEGRGIDWNRVLKRESWKALKAGREKNGWILLCSNEHISFEAARFEFENKDERGWWMSSDSGRIWSTGVGGGKKQRGLLMTRQTNRVGMHSVDFQGGKASSTSTSTNFSSVVWLRLLSTLDENISRESCFLFSRTRGWKSDRHRGTTRMEKLVLIHHCLNRWRSKYCIVLCFVRKISSHRSWNIFFLFFLFYFISSLSISFIYERFLLLFLNFKSGYLLVATFFASCRQFENVQHIRTSALILENLSLSLSSSYSLDCATPFYFGR